MRTVLLDIDLASLPPEAALPADRERAFVVVRYRGRPVGAALLPGPEARAGGERLRSALEEAGGRALRLVRLEERIGWRPLRSLELPAAPATIGVCTRDRPEDLRRCLTALRGLPDDGQEILVVDSASSSDETEKTVRLFPGVRFAREDRPGLNRARNRVLREARRPIVAFTDDDAAPEPLWLRALARNFEDRLVRAATGLTLPLELETEAQVWRERLSTFGRGFERLVLETPAVSPAGAGHAGAGVNMAVLRSVLDRPGPFDEALDAGTRTRSGGDTEMFSRILGAGYRVVYDPEAVSRHRHSPGREETRRTFYGYGAGAYAAWTRSLLFEHETTVLWHAAAWLLKHQLPALFRSLLRRPGSAPFDLVWAEIRGCAAGPFAYLRARREAAR
ncbi:MAG: glycosyltransferase [Candidatus Eisenbacteria bacterium]